ncbi:MAG TPA: hypothetical protein VKP13_10855 [Nitrospira sp.]|nr:hypothetical protein [Nitrospira sp.]
MRISFWLAAISLFISLGLATFLPSEAKAQELYESSVTTERSCSFGMAKGEPSQHCRVTIPAGCLVAHAPGTKKPWTTISKGGKTFCRFDDNATDWKTKITGTCSRCSTAQCTVQFIVRFDCNPH